MQGVRLSMKKMKICPKCGNTNTWKASKLDWNKVGSWFCKDCAIYYNISREEALTKGITQ